MARMVEKPENQISREEFDNLIADLRSDIISQTDVLRKLGLEKKSGLYSEDMEQFITGLLFQLILSGKLEGTEDKGYNPNEGRRSWEPPVY